MVVPMNVASRRSRARLVRHYLPFGAAGLALTAAVGLTSDSPFLPYRVSLGTAFASLALFSLSLVIGPVALLWRRRMLAVSTDLRRDVGILSAVFAVIHVAFGLFVYGDIRGYFVYPPARWAQTGFPLRLDDFGAANWTGLIATVIVVGLLATSGDWALRRYGARRWKALQRFAYWAFALVAVHGIVYQRLDPHAQQVLVVVFGVLLAVVGIAQAAGFGAASQRVVRVWSALLRSDSQLRQDL
jgi:sulfoxide reductase heme-binding subunit YedZ